MTVEDSMSCYTSQVRAGNRGAVDKVAMSLASSCSRSSLQLLGEYWVTAAVLFVSFSLRLFGFTTQLYNPV